LLPEREKALDKLFGSVTNWCCKSFIWELGPKRVTVRKSPARASVVIIFHSSALMTVLRLRKLFIEIAL